MAQCTFEYLVSLLVADAFLAKLLNSLGISDAWIGIISSFITMAFMIQLFSIFLVRSRISTKTMVISFDTVSIFFFNMIYIVPFLPIEVQIKKAVVVLSILLAYIAKYLILSICFKWANSYVEPTKRASYSATKEIISLISGIIFTAAVGYIIDKFESIGNLNGGFLFIAASMLILNICNFISLFMIKKESNAEHDADAQPVGVVLKNTLGNKSFRNVIVLTVLWDVARYFTIGFLGIYKTKELMLSVFAVQVINMAANICRIFVSKPFGRYSDRKSFAKGFEMALIIAAAGFMLNIFTTPDTWGIIIIYTVLYNVSLAGSNMNSFNITYSYVKPEYVTQAMAFKNCIGGIFGFGASLLGGKILNAVQAGGNRIFGFEVYGQQILSAISFIVTVVAILFIHLVVAKQKVRVQ